KTVPATTSNGYTFFASDFGFTDADVPANTLTAVTITTLPAVGTLKNNGSTFAAGQSITVADIAAGKLVFTPANGASAASGYDSFTFQVQDNGSTTNGGLNLDQSPNTITINLVAGTTLTAGDIAVIGYNTNATPDSFTIVVLKTLTEGTQFYVNDDEVANDG